jgi:hypothetical protein
MIMTATTSLVAKRPMKQMNEGNGDIGELIATLFLSREIAHREHLKTQSFAQHKTLEEFYNNVIEIADSITEAYQGRNGLFDIPFLPNTYNGDIVSVIQSLLDCVEGCRYQAVDSSDTAIQNLIDEAVAIFLSTLYKLKNLK